MKAIIAAAALVATHAIAVAALPGNGMAISYLFFFLVAALAMVGAWHAWRQATAPRDGRWWLLLASLAMWTMGMALSARQSYVLDNLAPAPGDSMFFYILYMVPVLVAISSTPVPARKRWAQGIDVALATLLGVLFYVRAFSRLSAEGAMNLQQATDMAWMLDVENACLAVAASLRFFATDRVDDQALFRAVTAFFVTYAFAGYFYNHGVALGGHPDFGMSPWDVLVDLPFLALFVATSSWSPQRHWHPSVHLVRFVQNASPTFLAMAVFGLALVTMPGYPTLGVAGAIAAVMGIGLRGTLVQTDTEERQRRLPRRNEELDALVFIDGLTGLANRRAFDERLLREWRRHEQGQPVALLMIDVDFFKEYNDRYGHLAGDDCLRALAGVVAGPHLRPGDVAARFGGEEFAVIAPATCVDDAVALAENLRAHVEAHAIIHPLSPYGVVTITVGVAVASVASHGGPLDLLAAADRALYRAKQGGRNRVGAPCETRARGAGTWKAAATFPSPGERGPRR